jgi:hypothetical protein
MHQTVPQPVIAINATAMSTIETRCLPIAANIRAINSANMATPQANTANTVHTSPADGIGGAGPSRGGMGGPARMAITAKKPPITAKAIAKLAHVADKGLADCNAARGIPSIY